MVTQNTQLHENVVLSHLIEVPYSHCFFASAKGETTGKSKLYLLFNHEGPIYARSGIRQSWEPINDQRTVTTLRAQIDRAREDKTIPCYSSKSRFSLK